MDQGLLPFQDEATISERFNRWLEDGGLAVYREFIAIARQLKDAGQEHYGAKSIMEILRYHRSIRGPAGDTWKINNNYSSRLARKAMAECPELAGFFSLRELKS